VAFNPSLLKARTSSQQIYEVGAPMVTVLPSVASYRYWQELLPYLQRFSTILAMSQRDDTWSDSLSAKN
jgi:hypothetical protein